MRLGREQVWAGSVAMAFGLMVAPATVTAWAQTPAQLPQAPAPQQQVPDAPTPQTAQPTLKLDPLTPAGPGTPAAQAAESAAPANGATQDAAPGSTLPASQVPTAQQVQDEGPPPELPAAGQGVNATMRLSVRVQFVEVPFTVKDSKNRLVPGLTWRDVRVYENGLRQTPVLFTVDPFPLSVALVIDQSVTQDTMEKINASMSALQGAFTPYDEVSVFTYNNGWTKLTDFTSAQSARLGAVLERAKGTGREALMPMGGPLASPMSKNGLPVDPNINRGQQGGFQDKAPREYHTLNDAILAAAEETSTAAKGRRRIVYVISDGKEYGSKASEKSVIKYLQTNKVSVYATLVGDSSIPGMGFLDRIHLPLTMRDDVLPRYAAATGGQVDPEFRPKGIENSFAHIAEEVRTQYTVGYYSHLSPLNDSYRKLEVRVLRPNLTIIAKEGYYPSASDSQPTRPATTPATTPTATPAAAPPATP